MMAYKGNTVYIYNVHMNVLEKLGWAGECLELGFLGYGGKVPRSGWWGAENGQLAILSG